MQVEVHQACDQAVCLLGNRITVDVIRNTSCSCRHNATVKVKDGKIGDHYGRRHCRREGPARYVLSILSYSVDLQDLWGACDNSSTDNNYRLRCSSSGQLSVQTPVLNTSCQRQRSASLQRSRAIKP